MSPCLWGLSIQSLKSLLSFLIALSKSRLRPSSTHLIIACGENKFLYFFKAVALAEDIDFSISFLF